MSTGSLRCIAAGVVLTGNVSFTPIAGADYAKSLSTFATSIEDE